MIMINSYFKYFFDYSLVLIGKKNDIVENLNEFFKRIFKIYYGKKKILVATNTIISFNIWKRLSFYNLLMTYILGIFFIMIFLRL